MKPLIYFNLPDKPEGMGQSQLPTSVQAFVDEHSDKLPNAVITSDRITFTKSNEESGYALIFSVPDDFQN